MDLRFVSSFSVITSDPSSDRHLFLTTLGLDLRPPQGAPDDEYVFSESIDGCKHFGVWPLSEAAQACFGAPLWPATHPRPQASVEFDVADPQAVDAAAAELEADGYRLLHPPRTEPWGQRIVRVQTPDGLIVGVSFTPWMHQA